jgi:rod shape-determining protein MreB
MFQFFRNSQFPDLYIDLGTANTLISARGRGVVVNEPSVIAYNIVHPGKKRIVAVGIRAKEQINKTPGNLFADRPLKGGVVSDFETTETMLRHFIGRPGVLSWMTRPKVVISIPPGITKVERQAVIHAGRAAGAREVILIDEPMAAAIGAGLPIREPRGSMIIDLGGGTTEVAIIALADIVYCNSARTGGHKMDEAIVSYAKRIKQIIIHEMNAEKLKIEIGTANPKEHDLKMRIQGRDVNSGLNREVEFTSRDIALAINDCIEDIIIAIKKALENTPPELLGDIIDTGIVLTGGGSLLRGLDKKIQKEIKIPIRIAENPLVTIAQGGESLLRDAHLLSRVQIMLDN